MAKALLVEDDSAAQIVTKMMLTRFGCEVDIASSGNEALDKSKCNSDYAIYFVDLGLPDMSGMELIKAIRQVKGDALPIIAVTGYTSDSKMQACLDAGATEIMHKPVIMENFKEVLVRYKLFAN